MQQESFNISTRKFLKKVGITAQQEIERAVREGIAQGKIKGNETLSAHVDLVLEGAELRLTIVGEISLE